MRSFLALAVVSLVIGIAGILSLWTAAAQYNDTIRIYTRVFINYHEDSFVWLEPDFRRARATFVIENDSSVGVTVKDLNVNLRIDGQQAGAFYDRFERLPIPEGESRMVEVELAVTDDRLQQRGGTATLSLTGSAEVEFDETDADLVDEDLVLDINEIVGTVDQVE